MADTDISVSGSVLSEPAPSPLALELGARTARLAVDLGGAALPPAIAAFANPSASPAAPSQLLSELAGLASTPGTSVLERFAPLALDIVARWLDDTPTTETWEARLAVLAALAETRPDIWP
jgi:hypothetical protein